jgi:DNA mismatch repair protein MutL
VSGGLVIVDQHAAHERILYEEALERMRGQAATAQQILFSQIIDLTRAEFELVVDVLEPLSRLGFDLAPISPPSVLLRGVPAGLSGRDPVQLLRDLLDGIGEESGRQLPDDELTDRLAKSYACHAAVRAGQPLSLEEMNHLVDRLFATSLPHGDPHGRPSFVRVDLRELHARFGRSTPTD